MSKFYNITEAEMHEFLTPQGFVPIKVKGTKELVYSRRCDQDNLKLSLRVNTGIEFGQSRECGSDAMRIVLVMKNDTGEVVIVGGSKKVLRVENWRTNLQARINGFLEYLPKHKCPKCGKPLIVRENKGNKTKFLSCTGYNHANPEYGCRYTENIK